MYGDDHKRFKSMADLMKKEFPGNFGIALEFLALPLHQARCDMIQKATKGVGASVNIVWSIVCGRTNKEMEVLKKTYFVSYVCYCNYLTKRHLLTFFLLAFTANVRQGFGEVARQ